MNLDIPFFITSYNRVSCLKELVKWCQKAELTNVIIIDNASIYPPLLEYLKEVEKDGYKVHRLSSNMKHYALWECEGFNDIVKDKYFVLTDPDIIPIEDCPLDVIDCLYEILQRHSSMPKVGLGLKIDDIPDYFSLKRNVLYWESQYWTHPIYDEKVILFEAPVDTTFALYRPGVRGWQAVCRTGYPYIARHVTWYKDLIQLSEEDLFYRLHSTDISNWIYGDIQLYLNRQLFDWRDKVSSI